MDSVHKNFHLAPDLKKIGKARKSYKWSKNQFWHHNIFWTFFLSKKGHILLFCNRHMTSFFQQKLVPECKPEWNREAITVFSRLPSLKRLQGTPLLQTSLAYRPTVYKTGVKTKKRNQNKRMMICFVPDQGWIINFISHRRLLT